MPLRIKCPTGHTLIVPDDRAGRTLQCPRCDKSVVVPGSDTDAAGKALLSVLAEGIPAASLAAGSLRVGASEAQPGSSLGPAAEPRWPVKPPMPTRTKLPAPPAPPAPAPTAQPKSHVLPAPPPEPTPQPQSTPQPVAVELPVAKHLAAPPELPPAVEPHTSQEAIESAPSLPIMETAAGPFAGPFTGPLARLPIDAPALPITEETPTPIVESTLAPPVPPSTASDEHHELETAPPVVYAEPAPPPFVPAPAAPVTASLAADAARTLAAYQLAVALTAAALFSVVPAVWDVVEFLQTADTTFVARWALALFFLGVVQLAYAVYLFQLPDWTTVWVVTVFSLALAAVYAAVLGLVLLSPPDGFLVGSSGLQLADKLAGGKAALWCLCMISLSTILAFFAGRLGTNWHRAEMMLRIAAA